MLTIKSARGTAPTTAQQPTWVDGLGNGAKGWMMGTNKFGMFMPVIAMGFFFRKAFGGENEND